MKSIYRPIVIAALALLSASARADRGLSTTATAPPRDRGGAILGVKAGALLPQAFSPLQASYFVELEGGYLLPWVRRLLSVTASLSISSPTTAGEAADPRLPGGGFRYEVRQDQLVFGLTLLGKIPLGRVVPYLGLGPRFFLLRTKTSGQALGGAAFPESKETSTEIGVGIPIGIDVILGPGRIFAEGQLLYAPVAQRATGDGSLGAIALGLGYRLVL